MTPSMHSRPAGEGETTQHTPRCWGRTSYSDEMAHCHCKPAGEGEREAVAILKGIGKINGDGWKDTTTKGEVVFVWNAEKPAPYSPGQYPRIGNEGWSASTSQYDFTPASADDIAAILALIRPAAPDAGGGWMPIETAPRDGTWIQAWRTPPSYTGPTWEPLLYVRWEEDEQAWVWPDETYEVFSVRGRELADFKVGDMETFASTEFTHWMPLPAPPALRPGGER